MKKFLLISIVASQFLATSSLAQTVDDWGNESAGRFSVTGNVGYVYNFASIENSASAIGNGKANGGLGYGASLAFTHDSGFGLSANYLGLASKWSTDGVEYTNPYHVITVAYSYRLSFGAKKEWGIKLGLGLGASFANVPGGTAKTTTVAAAGTNSKIAGGASYKSVAGLTALVSGCGITTNVTRGNRFYTDGIAGATPDSGASGLIGRSCQAVGTPPAAPTVTSPAALTDAIIASQFYVGTGAKIAGGKLETGSATDEVGTVDDSAVSYGVWRRLFKDAPIMTGDILTSAHGASFARAGFNFFETRADYITRCSILRTNPFAPPTACESQAEGAVGAAAAAALVDTAAQVVDPLTGFSADTATVKLCTDKGAEYSYEIGGVCTGPPEPPAATAADGKAKAYPNFVFAPELAIEYDNGYFHIDINARYIQELFNPTYTPDKTGPLAIYVGGGLGVNF